MSYPFCFFLFKVFILVLCLFRDDAISCVDNGDGTYLVGVHIADVSYFVLPNTKLDEEVFEYQIWDSLVYTFHFRHNVALHQCI